MFARLFALFTPARLFALFTPERRQSIQLFFGGLAPLAILLGFGSEGAWEQILIVTGALLQFFSSLLSLVNVRRGDWGTGWAIVRGAIYALATVVSPVLVFFGFYDASTNATVLVGISLALGAFSNLLAIFIGKQQQLDQLTKFIPGKSLRADLQED